MDNSRALYFGDPILMPNRVSLASTPRFLIILTGSRALLQEIKL
ncbi:hypothetical protein NXF25_015088 [Crotalus adamanteus]|uniref:Uncharacterized protein n=1 Tax=Crotalus adamanteus TaxID=8729 RepID=A0AAW1AXV2_CROAD